MDDTLMSELVRRLQQAAQLSPPGISISSSTGSSPRGASLPGSEHELARRCLWPDGNLSTLTPPSGPSSRRTSSSSGKASPSRASINGGQSGAAPLGSGLAGAMPPLPWRDLPADVMSMVVCHLPLADVKAARLACRQWHLAISSHVLLLRPRMLMAKEAAQR